MHMEPESSFGEVADDKRFIALVVSDNEDDYDSSTDEDASDCEFQESTPKANIIPSTMKNSTNSTNSNVVNQEDTNTNNSDNTNKNKNNNDNVNNNNNSNNDNNNMNACNINNSRTSLANSPNVTGSIKSPVTTKRWSFISNHSSTSSTNPKKRWSALSSFTDSKEKDSKKEEKEKDKFIRRVPTQGSMSSYKKISSDQHFEQSPKSMKRSSTGSSLKQLFGLITLNDDNKENYHNHKKQETISIPSTSISYRSQPLMERCNTNIETPSSQRNLNVSEKNELPRRQPSRLRTHSPSISSLSSFASSSKWKFWQRGGNSIRNRTISRPVSTYSLVGSPTDPTTKTKSSFSELHKAIYANNNNNTVEDSSSSISNSLSKRLSSSNLSLSNLKHRSSQSSLKHRSSQSSLQRFKTRRKSNNMTEEGSVSSSGSYSHHPKISLPVVDQVSRDKIRTKLRNSSSLLSINSSLPIIIKDYDEVLLQQILGHCDISEKLSYDDDYIPVLRNSVKLSTHVWRAQCDGTSVIYKKIPLEILEDATYSKSLCLHELKMLRVAKGTTGLPYLLRSFVIKEKPTFDEEQAEATSTCDDKLYLLIILRDNGEPLSQVKLNTGAQAWKIFWQVVTIFYVAETKFEFEHRNLSLDHILVDGHLNVTLCDLKGARAYWSSYNDILFTRLDHPLFFQGGGDYQFDIYNLMRATLPEASWNSYEPRTNLLWLNFLLYKLLHDYGDKFASQERERLAALAQLLDPGSNAKRSIFKRNEIAVRSCGDLLRFK